MMPQLWGNLCTPVIAKYLYSEAKDKIKRKDDLIGPMWVYRFSANIPSMPLGICYPFNHSGFILHLTYMGKSH